MSFELSPEIAEQMSEFLNKFITENAPDGDFTVELIGKLDKALQEKFNLTEEQSSMILSQLVGFGEGEDDMYPYYGEGEFGFPFDFGEGEEAGFNFGF